MLEAYRTHVAERHLQGIPPKALDPEWTAGLVELLKNPPAGEEDFLVDLISNRVPPGVDEAAYVKASFLTALVNGEASSPVINRKAAVKLLGNMHGGYNVATLVELLDDDELKPWQLKSSSLPFWCSMLFMTLLKNPMQVTNMQGPLCSRGPMPSGLHPTTPFLRVSRLLFLKLLVKSIPMIYLLRKMPGHALIYRFTRAPCSR